MRLSLLRSSSVTSSNSGTSVGLDGGGEHGMDFGITPRSPGSDDDGFGRPTLMDGFSWRSIQSSTCYNELEASFRCDDLWRYFADTSQLSFVMGVSGTESSRIIGLSEARAMVGNFRSIDASLVAKTDCGVAHLRGKSVAELRAFFQSIEMDTLRGLKLVRDLTLGDTSTSLGMTRAHKQHILRLQMDKIEHYLKEQQSQDPPMDASPDYEAGPVFDYGDSSMLRSAAGLSGSRVPSSTRSNGVVIRIDAVDSGRTTTAVGDDDEMDDTLVFTKTDESLSPAESIVTPVPSALLLSQAADKMAARMPGFSPTVDIVKEHPRSMIEGSSLTASSAIPVTVDVDGDDDEKRAHLDRAVPEDVAADPMAALHWITSPKRAYGIESDFVYYNDDDDQSQPTLRLDGGVFSNQSETQQGSHPMMSLLSPSALMSPDGRSPLPEAHGIDLHDYISGASISGYDSFDESADRMDEKESMVLVDGRLRGLSSDGGPPGILIHNRDWFASPALRHMSSSEGPATLPAIPPLSEAEPTFQTAVLSGISSSSVKGSRSKSKSKKRKVLRSPSYRSRGVRQHSYQRQRGSGERSQRQQQFAAVTSGYSSRDRSGSGAASAIPFAGVGSASITHGRTMGASAARGSGKGSSAIFATAAAGAPSSSASMFSPTAPASSLSASDRLLSPAMGKVIPSLEEWSFDSATGSRYASDPIRGSFSGSRYSSSGRTFAQMARLSATMSSLIDTMDEHYGLEVMASSPSHFHGSSPSKRSRRRRRSMDKSEESTTDVSGSRLLATVGTAAGGGGGVTLVDDCELEGPADKLTELLTDIDSDTTGIHSDFSSRDTPETVRSDSTTTHDIRSVTPSPPPPLFGIGAGSGTSMIIQPSPTMNSVRMGTPPMKSSEIYLLAAQKAVGGSSTAATASSTSISSSSSSSLMLAKPQPSTHVSAVTALRDPPSKSGIFSGRFRPKMKDSKTISFSTPQHRPVSVRGVGGFHYITDRDSRPATTKAGREDDLDLGPPVPATALSRAVSVDRYMDLTHRLAVLMHAPVGV